MKKIILSIALFVGFVIVSSAQASATGEVPVAKPKAVIETAKPEPVTTATVTTTETKPAAASTSVDTKKSTKKSCCKRKSAGCDKKKAEAIKVD